METLTNVDLTEAQASAIARAMRAVAGADGDVDPRELALIREIGEVGEDSREPEPSELAALLPERAERELLVRSAILVALVDGNYSEPERAVVTKYGSALGFADTELDALASDVKSYLMAPLMGLSNMEAVAEVSSKLKV